MNKNLFLIGLGVVILVAAGILFFKEKPQPVTTTENPATQSPQSATEVASTSTKDTGVDASVDVHVGTSPVVISFTDNGYSPTSVTIKKGQTVRFVNNATVETWPASANHPSHTVYPEKTAGDCLGSAFDACRGLKSGESWDFTFNSIGSWGFHDHLHANKRGTVVVTQ